MHKTNDEEPEKPNFKWALRELTHDPYAIIWLILCIIWVISAFTDPAKVSHGQSGTTVPFTLLSQFVGTLKLVLPALLLSLIPGRFFSSVFLALVGSGQFMMWVLPLATLMVKGYVKTNQIFQITPYLLYLVVVLCFQLLLILLAGELARLYKDRRQYNYKHNFLINWLLALKLLVKGYWLPLVLIYGLMLILRALMVIVI